MVFDWYIFLVALSLFALFALCIIATQIPRLFRSPINDLIDVLGGLASISGQMADLGSIHSFTVQPEKQGPDNQSKHYAPLFIAEDDIEKDKTIALLPITTQNSLN